MQSTSVGTLNDEVFTNLQRDYYVSSAWFDREMQIIFKDRWLYVGHTSEVSAPGDFIVRRVRNESLIITRDERGDLRALVNVCRHRAARVCVESSGSTKRFVCPYHQWTYGADGGLIGAPSMPEGFAEQRDTYGLPAVAVQAWNGLIFVNFAQSPPEPLAEVLVPWDEAFAPFGLAEAKVAHTVRYDVASNWKLLLDNFYECYHCVGSHPEFCHTVDMRQLFGRNDDAASEQANDWPRASSHQPPVTPGGLSSLPLKDGALSLTITGERASKRMMGSLPAEVSGSATLSMFPGFSVGAYGDYAITFDFDPVDVAMTRWTVQWLVAGDAREGADYDVDELIALWDVTNQQDIPLCESAQLGVNSAYYTPGPYSARREPYLRRLRTAYRTALAGAEPRS